MTAGSALSLVHVLLSLNVKFPENAMAWVEQALRWLHFLAGITWIGLLYFFNLVNVPFMKALDAPTRGKVVPQLMPRALLWFRWGAVFTVLAGLLYFIILMNTDATNAGDPGLLWRWFFAWLVTWVVDWAIIYFLLQPTGGPLNKGSLVALLIAVVVIAAAGVVLGLNSHPGASNKSLSIAVGGGIGTVMLLNVWGIIWPAQKRVIAWTKANVEQGTPIPPESAKLARIGFKASRANAWLSIPMLFFMGASSHFPFLSGK
jgi:uncharacterized membrane protein